ncbi:MAG: hypothetical protein ACUVTG_16805 [Candidatus Oleimicrobiaceae bacterium]
MTEVEIGRVTHYFGKIGVVAVELTNGDLAVGDTVHIKGHSSDFSTTIQSMQIEHTMVTCATKGQVVGIKVPAKAHEHDKVFKVTEP